MKRLLIGILGVLSLSTNRIEAWSDYLFSPKGGVTERIVQELNKASSEIFAAVYMVTSRPITDALVAACARGVTVKIVTDASCAQSPYGKIYELVNAGVEVRVPVAATGNRKFPPLMHTKYAVIDQKIVIEGSFNWTQSAERSNEEHVRISNNAKQIMIFLQHFARLFDERATTQFECHEAQISAWERRKTTTATTQTSPKSSTTSGVAYASLWGAQWIRNALFLTRTWLNSRSHDWFTQKSKKKSCQAV